MNKSVPLELQSTIRGLRTSVIIMAVITLLVGFIPWTIFYIILAIKLKPGQVPKSSTIKAAAIWTLPLCFGIIPIIIDVEFWKANKQLKMYEEMGAKVFVKDKEWLANEPQRKKKTMVTLSIILAIFLILALIIVMGASNNQSSTENTVQASSSPVTIASSAVARAKAQDTLQDTLPKTIDSVTILTDISSTGNTIQYHEQIHDKDMSNVTNASLNSIVKPTVCANSDMLTLLKAGVNLEYLYTVKETGQQYTVTVTDSDCT